MAADIGRTRLLLSPHQLFGPAIPGCSRFPSKTRPGHLVVLALLQCVAVVAGCGGDGKVPVSGTVTWNGKPLADGNIIFTPMDPTIGPDASRVTNGRFEFRSSPGKKRVEVFADRAVGAVDPVMHTQRREQYIPTRYNEDTELTVRVNSDGENRFTFDLIAREGDKKAGSDVSTSATD